MNARLVEPGDGHGTVYIVEDTGGWPIAHGQVCERGAGYCACPAGALRPLPGVFATTDDLLDHLAAGRGEAAGGGGATW